MRNFDDWKCHATYHDISQSDVKENDNPKSFTINFFRLMKLGLILLTVCIMKIDALFCLRFIAHLHRVYNARLYPTHFIRFEDSSFWTVEIGFDEVR
jgi:hypothetical protein